MHQFHTSFDIYISFSTNQGLVENFKKRHGIRLLKICGEKLSGNHSSVPDIIANF